LPNAKTVHIEAGATYQGQSYYNSAGIIRLGEDRLWYRHIEYDPASDANGWEASRPGPPIKLARVPMSLLPDGDQPEGEPSLPMPETTGKRQEYDESEMLLESDISTKETGRRVWLSKASIPTADEVLVELARAGDTVKARLVDAREIPRQDDVQDAAVRVDRLMRQIRELIKVMEFDAASEQAARLEEELDKAGPVVSPKMASQAYYCLYEMESERARHLGASDLSKAAYYLERAHHAQR